MRTKAQRTKSKNEILFPVSSSTTGRAALWCAPARSAPGLELNNRENNLIFRFSALRAGARGYVLKDAEKEDLLRAIRAVGHGEAIFSPGIASRIVEYFAATRPAAPKEVFPTLSERERELLHLLAQGHSNASIAGHLFLSQKTVANYVSTILNKLQVADRAEAILRAREAGLGAVQ